MTGPLEGVRVLSLQGLGPVPFANMLLADLGADVIRVTRPSHRAARDLAQTAAMSLAFNIPDRGTRSIDIDLKSATDLDRLRELVAHADVLIEGYRPGVAERLGIGPEALLAVNPALVYARLTGFGQDSDHAMTAGHDINYIAESGALHTLGRPGEHPRPPANLLGDYAGGGTLAAFGIVSALLHARDAGQGQVVDAAMTDGSALLLAKLLGLGAAGVMAGEPGTHFIDGAAPFYSTYECSDGRFIALGALEGSFYAEFLMGLPVDTATWPDQNDREQWPRLRSLIAEVIATEDQAHWVGVFDDRDACVSPVLTPAEAQRRHASRGIYATVDGVLQPAPTPRFSATPTAALQPPADAPIEASVLLKSWQGPERN